MTLGFDRAPRALYEGGRFLFGTYDRAIERVNLLDAWPRPLRPLAWLGLKEWEAFQAGDDEWFLLGAVYCTKKVDLLQLLAVHKASAKMHKWEHKLPPLQLTLASGLEGSASHGRAGGLSVRFDNDVPRGSLRVTASAEREGDKPTASLTLRGRCGAQESGHLVSCHPFPDGRPFYSHKCMMPAEGTLWLDEEAHALTAERSFLLLDDHKGFYPWPMRYDWLTAVKRSPEGGVLGFNLTANQMREPERYNENALFRGRRVDRLPPVRFERPDGVMGRWRVRDAQGRVAVDFTPVVRNEVSVGPGKIFADYHGPFGWVEGVVYDGQGEAVHVDGLFGMGEKKLVRV